jgi:hypothetical protein
MKTSVLGSMPLASWQSQFLSQSSSTQFGGSGVTMTTGSSNPGWWPATVFLLMIGVSVIACVYSMVQLERVRSG